MSDHRTVVRGGRGREEAKARDEEAREKERVAKERLSGDLRHLMGDPVFHRWLQHLMRKCGTFDSTEVLTAEAYRIAARRHVGMEVMQELGEADRKLAASLMAQMLYDTLEPEPDQNAR